MTTLVANYENEQRAFRALLRPKCNERILLYRGLSGSGKTTLLKYFIELVPSTIVNMTIQMRESAVSLVEIFSRASQGLPTKNLVGFITHLKNLNRGISGKIDKNWLGGINNQIQFVLNAPDPKDREQRSVELTDVWFNDLAGYKKPFVILFDTFEQANMEVREWISGPFLSRVAKTPNVRVIVAGQQVPDSNNIEWGYCSSKHELYGVRDAKHWMPIVKAMNRKIDTQEIESPMSWLAGICHALKGNPAEIMKVIEGLPMIGGK
jgi:energy-coupling factor transporter ATP-binding protein EcfA2